MDLRRRLFRRRSAALRWRVWTSTWPHSTGVNERLCGRWTPVMFDAIEESDALNPVVDTFQQTRRREWEYGRVHLGGSTMRRWGGWKSTRESSNGRRRWTPPIFSD